MLSIKHHNRLVLLNKEWCIATSEIIMEARLGSVLYSLVNHILYVYIDDIVFRIGCADSWVESCINIGHRSQCEITIAENYIDTLYNNISSLQIYLYNADECTHRETWKRLHQKCVR